jgi:Rieske 2Fe-2S family protein
MAVAERASDWISDLAQQHSPGWNLEQPFYTSAEVFQADLERIWYKYWNYVGHASQLPHPGAYFTTTIGAEPIVILRDEESIVRALANVCRHRGSLVCNEPAGTVKKLVCPYHQWVYDLDGSLRAAKLFPEPFDRSQFGMFSLHVRVLEGFIFVSLAENPPDFDRVMGLYRPSMQMYDLPNTKIAFSRTYPVQANWKLIAENFRECYHCGVGHQEYCSVIIGANLDIGREKARQVREESYRRWAAKGVPVTRQLFDSPEVWYYHERYPYQPGFTTMSADGKPLAPPLGQMEDIDVGVWSIVQYPNFWLDVNHDYAWAMRLNPVSATETAVTASWLVRADAEEGKDYDLDRLIWFWKATAEQDWRLCKDNQAGVNSMFYRPGPYSDYAEGGPGQFVDWYLGAVTRAGREA